MIRVDEWESDDSSFNRSSTSMENVNKFSLPKQSNSRKRLVTSWKNPRFVVSRRDSLVECLKEKITQPRLRRRPKLPKPDFGSTSKHESTGNDDVNKDGGDKPGDEGCHNQACIVYPNRIVQQQARKKTKGSLSSNQAFPFEKTPSGNFKLKPSQIVYRSKNLSVLAADPQKVVLNVTSSNRTEEAEQDTNTDFYKPGIPCPISPLANIKGEMEIPHDSEFSDTTILSDSRPLNKDGSNEIALARMGFVADNCIEWSKIQLPKKSDLKKLVMQNIANKVNPDVRIKIGNTKYTFDCHRIVLQCYSAFFSGESGNIIELPVEIVSKETFSLIYQWMLYQDTESYQIIRRDSVLDVFKASQYLGIKELEKQCLAFIENNEVFFEDKAFLLYLEARKKGNKTIMKQMVPRVQRFFLTLVSAKEFVELSLEEVCTFLSSDYASVHNETEMLMAAVRWLSHDWSARRPFAVDAMRCVRFQFIDSKSLLLLRRTKQPPEIMRVVDIPEVMKMMDDAIAYHTIRAGNEKKPEEELDDELKKMNLSRPAPRNWTGTHKDCRDYREFLQDLSRYRSKHRMEVKKSRMEMQTRDLDEDDFLTHAVLPENVQKRLNLMKHEDRSRHGHLPKLPPREQERLKRVLCEEESEKEVQPQARPCLKAQREFSKPVEDVRQGKIVDSLLRVSSKEELDKAARKIQKVYRGYRMRKTPSKDPDKTRAMRSIHLRSASDSNIPSSLSMTRDVYHGGKTKSRLEMHTGVETVFTFGGFDPYKSPQSVDTSRAIYRYELATNSWERCGELPQPRHYHGACLYRGKIYIAGGKHPSHVSDEGVSRKVWCYDPDYRTWSRVADLLRPRRAFGFVVCRNRLFAVGGRDAKNRVLSSVEKYDTESDCWVQVRRMHEPRTGAGVCEFEGGVWVAGGLTGPDCQGSRTVESYDPAVDAWSYRTPLRYVCAFPALLPVDGRLHLVAGAIGHDRIVGSGRHIDVLDPRAGGWCLSSTLAKCRHAHAAAFLRGVPRTEPGHLLVLGGIVSRRECAVGDVECWRARDDVFVAGVAPLPAPACGFSALVLPRRTF